MYLSKETSKKDYQDKHLCPFLGTESGSLKWMSHSDVSIHSETDNEPTGHEIGDISQIVTKFTCEVSFMVIQKPSRLLCSAQLSYEFCDIISIDELSP